MISAALIVRNEAALLPRCLRSLRGVADEIVVVDTGSTDATVETATAHGARVLHFPWCEDFSAARNFAVEHASGDCVLTIDADEYLSGNPAEARAALEHFAAGPIAESLGLVTIVNELVEDAGTSESIDHTTRVFSPRHFRYQGAIHEQLVHVEGRPACGVEVGLTLRHTGYSLTPEEAAAKAKRNIALLRKELAAHPRDEYFRYQLAKAWQSMGRTQAAAIAFEQALRAVDFTRHPPHGRLGAVNRKVLTGMLCGAAYAHTANGEPARAVDLLQAHARMGHTGTARADFQHALGHALLHLGRLEEAQAAHERALGMEEDVRGTGSWLALYHLGLIALARGQKDTARHHFIQCRERWPEFSLAADRLKELEA
jgi:tetratricopeptide (TPR) repeat protein